MENLEIKIGAVIRIVSEKYNVTDTDIRGKSREKELIRPRFIVFTLLKKLGLSYSEIGRYMNRDHTTVMYGIKTAKSRWPVEISSLELDIKGISFRDLESMRSPFPLGRSKKWQWVYEIFKGRCAICGFSDVILVHHITPRSIGGTDHLSNLIVLCPNHHSMLHLGLVDISKLSPPSPSP